MITYTIYNARSIPPSSFSNLSVFITFGLKVAHYKITPENRNQRRNVYEHKVKKVRIGNKNESVQSSKG